MSSGYIEPDIYHSEKSDILQEAELLYTEKQKLSRNISGDLNHLQEAEKLMRFLSRKGSLQEYTDELFLEFNEIMEQKPVVTNSLASQGPLLEFFRFLDRNRDLAKVMIGPHGDLAFVNRLKDQIEKRTLQVLESAQSDANYEYLCSFIITGCVGVVETWLKESNPQSPEEMAEILGTMLLRQLNFAPEPA